MAAWMILGAAVCHGDDAWASVLKEGDIVFTGSQAGQGEAIIAATRSPFTHCGIVFAHEGKLMVLEAVQPVRAVPLAVFMGGDKPAVFAARRLKRSPDPAALGQARDWAAKQVGKHYDVRFGWGDDRLYCSELVWKVYQKAGIELCKTRKFRDYDLRQPTVIKLINARYGGIDRVPMDEPVVAPSDLAASDALEAVVPAR